LIVMSESQSIAGDGFQPNYGSCPSDYESDVSESDTEDTNEELDPRRWWVLGVFCYIQLMNGILYGTFSAESLEYTQGYFGKGVTKSDVNLLLNWGSILYIPLVPISVLLLNRGPSGIVLVVRVSAMMQILGTGIRCIPSLMGTPTMSTNIIFLNAGQICIALSSGVNAVPSSISATWFPKRQRMAMTAIGCASNFVGGATKFLIGLGVTSNQTYNYMMLGELVLAGIGAICAVGYFPTQPQNAVSKTGAARAKREVSGSAFFAQFANDMKVAFVQPSLWIIQGGVVYVGVLGAWQASIPVVLTDYTPPQKQWLGFIISVSYSIGCLGLGDLIERFFHQRYKFVLFWGQVFTCLFMALGMLGMNSFGKVYVDSYTWVVTMLSLMTFVNGALYPCMMELAAEVAYPAEEGAAGGLVTLICQMSTSASLFMFDWLSQSATTYLVLGSCVLGVVAFAVVKEEYKRSNADDAADTAADEEKARLTSSAEVGEGQDTRARSGSLTDGIELDGLGLRPPVEPAGRPRSSSFKLGSFVDDETGKKIKVNGSRAADVPLRTLHRSA